MTLTAAAKANWAAALAATARHVERVLADKTLTREQMAERLQAGIPPAVLEQGGAGLGISARGRDLLLLDVLILRACGILLMADTPAPEAKS